MANFKTVSGAFVEFKIVEVEGMIVRTRVEMSNAYHVIRMGSLLKVTSAVPRWGLTLERKACERCGVAVRITKVNWRDVLLTLVDDWDLAENV